MTSFSGIFPRLLLGGLTLAAFRAEAAPLQEANVSKIVNEVRIIDPHTGGRRAKLEEVIKNDLGVKTGINSRAELRFQDNTLTRLGGETYFSFQPGTRDMTLQEGTMLLQVPKNQGGARIKTAAVTASITGTTIMLEYHPGQNVKVLVLEGSLRLSVNGRVGETLMLTAGKMILMKPNDRHLPQPVDVDLAKVVKTSALIDPAAFKGKSSSKVDPLPSLPLIQKEIAVQQNLKLHNGLVETNLLIPGGGSTAVLASKETMAALEQTLAGPATAETRPLALNERAQTTQSQTIRALEQALVGKLKHGTIALDSSGNPVPVPAGGSDNGNSNSNNGESGKGKESDSSTESNQDESDGNSQGGNGQSSTAFADPAPEDASVYAAPALLGPPSGPLAGSINLKDPLNDLTVSTPQSAGSIKLEARKNLYVTASLAANTLQTKSDHQSIFDGVIQANYFTAEAKDLLAFHQAIGVGVAELSAKQVSGSAFNATSSLSIEGTYVGGGVENILAAPELTISDGINLDGANGRGGGSPVAAQDGKGLTIFTDNLDLSVSEEGEDGKGKKGKVAPILARGGKAATASDAGGSGGTVRIGTAVRPIVNAVAIGAPILATTGENGKDVTTGGTGGTISVYANGTIGLNAAVKVSESTGKGASNTGGVVHLESNKLLGTAIQVGSSGQILSLLNSSATGPGGRIELTSAGGDISVSGGTLQADRGTIELRNQGLGKIILQDAILSGGVVKANAFGPTGQLIVGGGSISADTAIKLYAEGAGGSVLFNNNTSLNGNSVKTIAGQSVTIANGKTVTINGPTAAQVFTNLPNYRGSGGNGLTSGKFGGKGATTAPFANRPAY